ncbi:hypothetical protein TIFTF001_040112 [Ficus carica]|uniref:Uncharacterized protein n=1 Tax=Ficus carica TaxID=3494 RepID=A0AA88CM82_FICCA|nr:hypothetical protein TIFTF001_040112 [Ficus carica]
MELLSERFVRAFNSLFEQWDAQAVSLWNISGEPCSGSAIDGSEFERPENNPAITCDCSYNDGTTCHITQMYATNSLAIYSWP